MEVIGLFELQQEIIDGISIDQTICNETGISGVTIFLLNRIYNNYPLSCISTFSVMLHVSRVIAELELEELATIFYFF